MFLAQSFVVSLLAVAGLALPSNEGAKHHANMARSVKYAPKEPPLTTPWTDKVGTKPWPEYPRPLLQRSDWKNLNGIWKYQNASDLNAVDSPPFGQDLAQEVLIPSCIESGLSGESELFENTFLVELPRSNTVNRYSNGLGVVLLVLHVFRCFF